MSGPCTAMRGKNVCTRQAGHDGAHIAEVRWEPRSKNPPTPKAVIAAINAKGELHVHKTAGGHWRLMFGTHKRSPCMPHSCLRAPLNGKAS